MDLVTSAMESGSILLREGLEAMLIIAMLIGFLKRAEAPEYIKALYLGAGAAVVASIVAAFIFMTYFNGMHDDRMEAIIMLVAAGLMFYVSGWLFVRQDVKAWMAELRATAERALASKTSISMGLISFFAVFREGAETILFMHALIISNDGWLAGHSVGVMASIVLLAVIYVLMQWLTVRLPLRPLFLFTSAFLFLMGLKFVGGAIQELQELTLLPYSDISIPTWLAEIGVNPSLEGMGIQGVIVLIAVLGALAVNLLKPKQMTPAE